MKRVPEERRVGVRERQSWKAGGSALNGQHPSRKTRSQTWHIGPQLHPAVTGVDKGKEGAGGGRRGKEGEEKGGYTARNTVR